MQILSKKESDMTTEERMKLKFMRTILVILRGVSLKDPDKDFNLLFISKAGQFFELFNKIYKLDDPKTLRDENLLNDHFPDKAVTYPGKANFESAVSALGDLPNMSVQNERMMQAVSVLLNDMSYTEEDIKKLEALKEGPKVVPPEESADPVQPEQDLTSETSNVMKSASEVLNEIEDVTETGNSIPEEQIAEEVAAVEEETMPETVNEGTDDEVADDEIVEDEITEDEVVEEKPAKKSKGKSSGRKTRKGTKSK